MAAMAAITTDTNLAHLQVSRPGVGADCGIKEMKAEKKEKEKTTSCFNASHLIYLRMNEAQISEELASPRSALHS